MSVRCLAPFFMLGIQLSIRDECFLLQRLTFYKTYNLGELLLVTVFANIIGDNGILLL